MRWVSSATWTSGEPVSSVAGAVLGDDLLLGLRVGASGHAQLLSVHVVARRAGACSPGHSRSAAVVRRMTSPQLTPRATVQDYQRAARFLRIGGGRARPTLTASRLTGRSDVVGDGSPRHLEQPGRACATCARRSAGWSSPLDDGPTGRGSPTCAATPTTRCRAGTSAPRRSPSRTSTRTPTGCAGRSAVPATGWAGDRLGRGARPGRRPGSPRAVNRARPGRAGDLPRQPQRAQPRLDDPRHRDGEVVPHPQQVQRHLGRPAAARSCWPT